MTAVSEAQAIGPSWLDPDSILETLGPYALLGLCVIIFAECGLLVGFFLPGDSLLFIAGLFVADDKIETPIWAVATLLTLCAVLGNVCGYEIGYRVGPILFRRPDSRLFKTRYVDNTHMFLERYGARAIVLARFVPVVRTFITAVAGVARMDRRTYFIFTLVGAIIWAAGMTLLGYWLGQVEVLRDNLELTTLFVLGLSFIPIGFEIWRVRREKGRFEERSS